MLAYEFVACREVEDDVAAGERLGLKTVGGFGMLFYQAVEAQKIWFGREIAPKAQRSIKKELEKLLSSAHRDRKCKENLEFVSALC